MSAFHKAFPYSDNLASIQHDGVDTLTVQFKKNRGPGPIWKYKGVPISEAEAIGVAVSPGSTFRRLIVAYTTGPNAKYTAEKVAA